VAHISADGVSVIALQEADPEVGLILTFVRDWGEPGESVQEIHSVRWVLH